MLENRIERNFLPSIFIISLTKCEKKYTAFASKLLQIPTKSIILTNCNLKQKVLCRLWLFDWYYKIRFSRLCEMAAKKCEVCDFMTRRDSV